MHSRAPHVDVIGLDPQLILGIGSDNYSILNNFRMYLGESEYF